MSERRSWVRSPVVGVLVGVLAGGLIVMLVEAGAHRLFGTAAPFEPAAVTTPMFASVLFAWVIGTAVGAAVATYWSGSRSVLPGIIVGVVQLAAAILNMVAFPHPAWMVVAAVILMPLAAILVSRRLTLTETTA